MGFLERGAAGPLLKGGRDGEEGLDWETAGMGLETAVLKGFVLGVRLMVVVRGVRGEQPGKEHTVGGVEEERREEEFRLLCYLI